MRHLATVLACALLAVACETAAPSSTSTPIVIATPVFTARAAIGSPVPQAIWRLDIPRAVGGYFGAVSPSARRVLRIDPAHSYTFFDLRGDQLGWFDVSPLDIAATWWLPDSTGVAISEHAGTDARKETLVDVSVFGPDRPKRTVLARGVLFDEGRESYAVSPDDRWYASETGCCPYRIVVSRLDGSEQRELFSWNARLWLLGWDDALRVRFTDGRQLFSVDLAARISSIGLGLAPDVTVLQARLVDQTPDRHIAFIGLFTDRPVDGSGQNNYSIRRLKDDRLFVTRMAPDIGWLNDHEYVTGGNEAYDASAGTIRSLGVDEPVRATLAVSGRVLIGYPEATSAYLLRLGVDNSYRPVDVHVELSPSAFPIDGRDGLFLVMGKDGWFYVIDGEAALR